MKTLFLLSNKIKEIIYSQKINIVLIHNYKKNKQIYIKITLIYIILTTIQNILK
jgi:hypothetical protein